MKAWFRITTKYQSGTLQVHDGIIVQTCPAFECWIGKPIVRYLQNNVIVRIERLINYMPEWLN